MEEEDSNDYVLEEDLKYIIKASIKLKCSLLTRCKALLICHNAKKCLTETRYDPLIIAAACLDLSIKHHEEDIEFDAIILVFFKFVEPDVDHSILSERFKATKKSVTYMETFILRMVEFDLLTPLAVEHLIYMLNDKHIELLKVEKWDAVLGLSLRIISDFYLSNKCVSYKAEDISRTVIEIVFYYLGCYNLLAEKQHLLDWLKALTDTPETTKSSITEDIFRCCFVGAHFENKRSMVHNTENL